MVGAEVNRENRHSDANAAVRIDVHQVLDPVEAVAFRKFLRELGASHLFDERLVPALSDGEARLFAAVIDRPWPPWGIGARTVQAMCLVHPVGEAAYGIGPVYVLPTQATNVGLLTALYKEALDDIARVDGAQVHYLVAEGSVLLDRVLRSAGFEPGVDQLLGHESRHRVYAVEAAALSRHLGLDELSVPELLAHEIAGEVYDRNATFHCALQVATRAELLDRVGEIVYIDGGRFNASKPGGVDETSGTPGPGTDPTEEPFPQEETEGPDILRPWEEQELERERVLERDKEFEPVREPGFTPEINPERLREGEIGREFEQAEKGGPAAP